MDTSNELTEPSEVRNAALGKVALELLPLRTVQEAWAIVTGNYGLIKKAKHHIRFFKGVKNISEDDIESIITLHFFRAALYWNPEKGKLSTYFFACLPEAKQDLKEIAGLVRFPRNLISEIERLDIYREKYPGVSLEKIAEKWEVPLAKLIELSKFSELRAGSLNPVNGDSLFNSLGPTFRIYSDLDGNKKLLRIDELDADVQQKMRRTPEDDAHTSELAKKTREVLALLTPREERVARLRFGIGEKKEYSLEEIGIGIELDRTRIRQIEAKAMRKLRHPSRSKALKLANQ
ncbi:MAG: sigma-70 family RNA polymerase sigma factor [Candidatus Micrarchaeota archaeon]|nr:sigma-70 family RNA polymerase sigma factor [Candidatus Micrarchaeota archaeon]